MLCEGRTLFDLESKEFWQVRKDFLSSFVDDFDPRLHQQLEEDFLSLPIDEAEEVVFWFEYDLFCQVNLLALLSWMAAKTTRPRLSLVCVGKHPSYDKLVGLGEMPPSEYPALYAQRASITAADLAHASLLWQQYCSANHQSLLETIRSTERSLFPYLEGAFEAHQSRFPSCSNGLSPLEAKLLEPLSRSPHSARQLIGTILRSQGHLGFGDLQYERCLDHLSPLISESDGLLQLTELGEQVLQHEAHFGKHRLHFAQIGGASQKEIQWDDVRQELV